MLCLYCHKKIGLLRRLSDSQYCSQEHRAKTRTSSARALRNLREYDTFDEYDQDSIVFVKPIDGIASKRPQSQSSMTSTATFGLLLVTGVFVATFGMSDGNRVVKQTRVSFGPFESVRRTIRSYATVRLQDDFKGGLGSWVTTGATGVSASVASGRDWSFKDGFVRPAKLRLWKDSVTLSDYNLEFVGEIEHKGMGWAYRAKDVRNYYANKIVITKPGPLPTADLVRYTVVNGVERNRASTRLNMTLRRDTLYKVHMTVKGSDFTTSVNGQMVDSWSDGRLRAGGVGFFTEGSEAATLRWVQLTDRDTVVGRLLSYIGMLQPMIPSL
jgi:hypothetical protein